MKKLLAIVISMAMIVAMMPMGVFAAEGESGTVEVTYPANVSNERELREALYNAPTDGSSAKIVLEKDITLEMIYSPTLFSHSNEAGTWKSHGYTDEDATTAAADPVNGKVDDNNTQYNTLAHYKIGVKPDPATPTQWNSQVTAQTLEQRAQFGAYIHATDNSCARLVIKDGQNVVIDLNGKTIAKRNDATHGDWSNTCTDIIGNYGTLKVTDNSDSETKGTIKGIGYTSCNGAVLHNYEGAIMTVGAVNVDGNAAGMSEGTGQYVISNESGTVTIDGTNVYDTATSASLLVNTAGTMTITGNAILNHPATKTVNCKGGSVNLESATITSDNYAIYAAGGTVNVTGSVIINGNGQLEIKKEEGKKSGTITKSENVQLPVPSGSIWTKVGDTEVLVNEASVAVVGGVGYENISDAINAASDNVTVTLLKDVNTSAYTEIRKPMTIDFGGNKFTSTDGGFDVYADLTLKNGTLNSVKWGVWVQSGAKLLVDSDMVINTTSTAGEKGGITVQNNGSKVTVKGTVTAAGGAAISGIGNLNDGGVTINIEEGAVITNTNSDGLGIYFPNTSNLNIKGGIITGATGVYIKSGQTNITGGIINGNGTKKAYEYCGDGGKSTGDALVVDKCGYPGGDPTITVNGGTFTSTNANAVASYVGNSANDPITKFISGGTFSTSPKAYVAGGNKVYKFSDTEYKVSAESAQPSAPAGYRWKDATGEDLNVCDYITEVIPYTPSTSATPADNVTNNTTDKSTTADLAPAVKDNKAETTVDAKTADKIVDKAVANKSTEVIVDATGNNTVASSEVAIPEKTVKELAEKTDANLVIKTDNGKVDLDKTAVKALADQAGTDGTVKLVVETVKTDENICHVDLKLITSNGAVKDFRGGNVKVTINLTKELAAKDVVCVYINDNGIYTLVEGVLNADGTYTFTTGHFSEYAVMAKAEADKKIAEQLDTMIKDVNLKVRTSKTAKQNIKAVVSGDVKAITDAGYTVKYKFYRSEKKASKYEAKATKAGKTYINTAGKKGTKYYYKAKALVYDGDKLVGQTVLTQCKYGVRTWSK